jgi:hypothetical protein
MKKLVRLTESDLHRIVKESVNRILNEVEGYENTMLKANPMFNKDTLRGKVTRFLNPKKANQFDRIHNNAEKNFKDASNSYWHNRSMNFPSAFDPHANPSQEDVNNLVRDKGIMDKYKVGQNGLRNDYPYIFRNE